MSGVHNRGLPKNFGSRWKAPRLTEAQIIDAANRLVEGETLAEIGAGFGVPACVVKKAVRLDHPDAYVAYLSKLVAKRRATVSSASTRTRRLCLRCRRPFSSAGSGNRLCESCKTAINGVESGEVYGAAHSGHRHQRAGQS